jgi:hypothetical protein
MLCEKTAIHGSWFEARWTTAFCALALVLCCAACSRTVELTPLTPRDIAESGTLVLDAPRQTVFGACVLALRKQGYAIDVAEPETGLVVTMRRRERESPPGRPIYREYIVEVKDLPGGRAQVEVWPSVTEADTRMGNRPYTAPAWDLDEERAAWTRLFEDVRGIVERASP